MRILTILAFAIAGCVVAPIDEEDSDSSLIEGATEGSNQSSAAAQTVRSGALFELNLARTRGSMEVGFDAGPILSRTRQGPANLGRAALELRRTLVEERGMSDAAVVLDQFLSADPSSATGPIMALTNDCATFEGFFLGDAIAETDPPLARIVIGHDSSLGTDCHVDGTVHYDLRAVGRTVMVEVVWPEGLSVQSDAGTFVIAPGGSMSLGLAVDDRAVVAGADYCVSHGDAEACFEDVELAVTGAITATLVDGTCAGCASYGDALVDSLAGHRLQLELGASIVLDATGTIAYGDDSITFAPLSLEVGADGDGPFATLDGDVSATFEGETASFTFTSMTARVPALAPTVVLDGCVAWTIVGTHEACFDGLAITVEPGSVARSVLVTADGPLTFDDTALYTFTGTRAQILGRSVTLDGSVTRTVDTSSLEVSFEAFDMFLELPTITVGGIVETRADATRVVLADFCPGSTYERDRATGDVTLTGCVSLDSAFGTLALGTETDAMAVSFEDAITTFDGPLAYDDARGNHLLDVAFTGWMSENLEPGGGLDGDYHRRLTGLADVDMLGFSGSIEADGIEARFVAETDAHTVSLDGGVTISIETGRQTVAGELGFTGYSAAFVDESIGHMGVIDMELTTGTALPTSSMRVTFGDGTTPLTTVHSGETTTTIDGRLVLGLGCGTTTCNENINVVLTGVAFDSPPCGRQHPRAGTAAITGLNPTTSALIPALRVRCECDGRAGRETLLPRRVNMQFTTATPLEGRIQIPSASGNCGLRAGMCNEPGAAWLREPSVCRM